MPRVVCSQSQWHGAVLFFHIQHTRTLTLYYGVCVRPWTDIIPRCCMHTILCIGGPQRHNHAPQTRALAVNQNNGTTTHRGQSSHIFFRLVLSISFCIFHYITHSLYGARITTYVHYKSLFFCYMLSLSLPCAERWRCRHHYAVVCAQPEGHYYTRFYFFLSLSLSLSR